jgi:hypothetical protein
LGETRCWIVFYLAEPISVITEYCARGNLKHVLKKYGEILNGTIPAKSEPKLTNDQLLSMSVDVACAMKHLVAMKVRKQPAWGMINLVNLPNLFKR